jgi:hypothetical protein
MVIDTLFLIASAAFGWGLSLATYRMFAVRNGWPMGEVQADQPVLAVMAGVFAIAAAFLFAAARGSEAGGWGILVLGLVLALLWTGVLRVGSQMSLFLAPLAAVALLLGWAHIQLPGSDREIVPNKTYLQRERSGQAPVVPQIAPVMRTRGDTGSTQVTQLSGQPKPTERIAGPEIRDEQDRVEVLPPAPSGLPRPLDPANLEDPALLQPRFAAPQPKSDARRGAGQPVSKIE